ncbi:MAG: crossover junction endodeoxyribonuclease RuvC [Myxococcales bacterium]|nr:MAG: crossover junction endodeoxyribonuclease RuvC [Myxococcales bacterium]
MRTIGVDPGSRAAGYGVVEKQGSQLVHIDCGVIVPPKDAVLPARLLFIENALEEVVRRYRPEQAAVEDVFYSRNWRSALKLGQARGAVLAALAREGLEIVEYAPARVKLAVVGFGRAEKEQVQQMVRVLLGLPEIPEENAADALALAICRLHDSDDRLRELLK